MSDSQNNYKEVVLDEASSKLLNNILKATSKKPTLWTRFKNVWNRRRYYRGKQTATIRISHTKVDVDTVSPYGPSLFGFRPLSWFYSAYHAVTDYLFVRSRGPMLKAPIYGELTKRLINHPYNIRMRKIGEIDRPTTKTHTL